MNSHDGSCPIRLPYGRRRLELRLPETIRHEVVQAASPAPVSGPAEILDAALRAPIQSPTLRELTRTARRIVIITDDNTRPMPSRLTLPAILRQFARPESEYDITILVATGLHRPMTTAEQEEQFGKEFCRTHRIVCHNARDPEQLAFCGTLPSGNPLYLNKLAAGCDLLIAEGFIEPHFFAGFSGGRKSILPGISGEETILRNHCPINIANPLARQGILAGNPVHEECAAAARLSPLRFILNVALNSEKEIVAAFAGDPAAAHAAGCDYVSRALSVPARPADIVITSNSGYPLDRNLYQAVKGIDTAAKVVRDQGVIIMAAQCCDGVGHDSFAALMQSCRSVEALEALVSTPPLVHDKWQAQVFARARKKASLILVNDGIPPETLRSMLIEPAPSLEAALELALAQVGRDPFVSILPDGPVTIPLVR